MRCSQLGLTGPSAGCLVRFPTPALIQAVACLLNLGRLLFQPFNTSHVSITPPLYQRGQAVLPPRQRRQAPERVPKLLPLCEVLALLVMNFFGKRNGPSAERRRLS